MAEETKAPNDLKGVNSLTMEAVLGIVDIVESMHATIQKVGGTIPSKKPDRAWGITGLVYQTIRTTTQLVGGGLDLLFDQLGKKLEQTESKPDREAVVAALNGVLGDHLEKGDNPLAIDMQIRHGGKALDQAAFEEAVSQSNDTLVLMVHGLCMGDLQFNRKQHDHGAALAKDLGICPLYLNYNTGLHIFENGKRLSELLEKHVTALNRPIKVALIGYSMGGLVSRSACHHAKHANHQWVKQLCQMMFLGTPHHGTALEKGGNWVDFALQISPYSAPFAKLGKVRSAGITDLRFGSVIEEDWAGRDRFELAPDSRVGVALPRGVECFALAGVAGKEDNVLNRSVIGDGMVNVNSALGVHKNGKYTLNIPKENQRVLTQVNHLEMLNNQEVYQQIRDWAGKFLALG